MADFDSLKTAIEAADKKVNEASVQYVALVRKYDAARIAFKRKNGSTPVTGVDSLANYGFSDAEAAELQAKQEAYTQAVHERREAKSAYDSAKKAAQQQALDATVDLAAKKAQSKKALKESTENPYSPGTINLGKVNGNTYYRSNGRNYVRAKDGSVIQLGTGLTGTEIQKMERQFSKLETKYTEKNYGEELAKQRAQQKAEEKERREAAAAAEKKRREEERAKRAAARKANEEEYETKLAEYKKQHEAEKLKYKQERADAAVKRHEEYVKQRKELAEQAEESGKNAYKSVNDYTYTAVEQYKQQEEQRKKTGTGYTGSSAQAKQELKDSIKDLWNMSTKDAAEELSGAYKGLSPSIDTLKNAKGTIKDILDNNIKGQGLDALKNSSLALQAAALNATDKDGMLEVQKAILTQKLSARVVMDQITDAVQMKVDTLQDAGTAVRNTLLLQRAYVAAYIKQTFGNPQFMANVTKVVSIKVDNYVEALAMEKVKTIDKKIDTIFTRIDDKLDKVSKKTNKLLDKVEKINVLESFNSAIDKFTSLGGLQKKLEKSPFGIILSPLVGAVSAVGSASVKIMLTSAGITGAVAKVQQKIVGLQSKIADARAFITSRIQMVRDYVNKLKEKAKAAIKQFANKVVADIKSKISSAVAGAFGGKGVSI